MARRVLPKPLTSRPAFEDDHGLRWANRGCARARSAVERLKEVPGLSETAPQILLAEIGTDMRQLPTAGHLLSWAGSHTAPRRECRRGALDAHEKMRRMAEACTRSVCLGRHARRTLL